MFRQIAINGLIQRTESRTPRSLKIVSLSYRFMQTSVRRVEMNEEILNSPSGLVRVLMRRVTQPVVIVTTEYEYPDNIIQRGLTVSSFTTVCLTPSPFVCFSTRQKSRAADLFALRNYFIVHLLPSTPESAKLAEAFSKSNLAPQFGSFVKNPFDLAPWRRHKEWKLPIFDDILGAFFCKVDRTVEVGDHRLWIAQVKDGFMEESVEGPALAYSGRRYRAEGDPIWPHDSTGE